MIGEGEFNLDVLKEIKATKSYMGMDQGVINCHNEPFQSCTTRQYKDSILRKCYCLPINIKLTNEVLLNSFTQLSPGIILMSGVVHDTGILQS